jgi:hypothetical protein
MVLKESETVLYFSDAFQMGPETAFSDLFWKQFLVFCSFQRAKPDAKVCEKPPTQMFMYVGSGASLFAHLHKLRSYFNLWETGFPLC